MPLAGLRVWSTASPGSVRLFELARDGKVDEAVEPYRWFMPLLHLDVDEVYPDDKATTRSRAKAQNGSEVRVWLLRVRSGGCRTEIVETASPTARTSDTTRAQDGLGSLWSAGVLLA